MINPRQLAVKMLIKSCEGSYSNLVLNKYLTPDIPTKDRAFVTELVYGVIQHRLRLDYIISQFSKIAPSKMSKTVLNTLRLGVYQMILLDRVPDFAAVNESVALLKKMEGKSAANFANAVLRNISRNKEEISYPDPKKDMENFLSVYYSFPLWLVKRWLKLYGVHFTEELCKSFNERPKVCIRINTLKTCKQELKLKLKSEGVSLLPGLFLEEALYIMDSPPLQQLKSFQEGLFQPQDESSMLASRVLGVKSGDVVLDAAAAPGGKTTHMAQMMKNEGRIFAWDIHPRRVELIKETCKRLGVAIISTQVKDARIPDSEKFYKFDKVMIDAPCSGLGVIRRKPDIKWVKGPGDIKALNAEQMLILQVCSKYVKPGGTLVYSTCSIDPEENQKIIETFLRQNDGFVYDDIRPYLPEKLSDSVDKPYGYIQLYPNVHKVDGFFISRLKRVKV